MVVIGDETDREGWVWTLQAALWSAPKHLRRQEQEKIEIKRKDKRHWKRIEKGGMQQRMAGLKKKVT